ncbi:MAG TPA: OmpA family protein [Bacteroidales bacterium]|nr:OmpA family protein [Bacteroidales bacterium]
MMRYILIIAIGIFALNACVPITKFKDVKKQNQSLEDERAKLKSDLEKLQVDNNELNSNLSVCEQDRKKLIADSLKRYEALRMADKDMRKLQSQYDELQSAQENLVKGSARENSKLLSQLQTTQSDLQKREEQLKLAEKSLDEKKRNLEVMQFELEKNNQKLKELQSILNRKDSAVAALKNKVSSALLGFENNGLSVNVKNGKVYVSLDEKLLFKSGSYVVEPNGVNALKKLSKLLEQNTDINVLIEGHTDDVPYRADASVKDNWDLSAKRATAVVRILLDNSRIDPVRLTAAGRSEYLPIDKSKTAQARQKNRRTEIILTPKLDELLKILENN